VPLYYTGLSVSANVQEKEGFSRSYKLNRDYSIDLVVTLEADGYTWFVIE
jgi:hypothetical protein